MIKYIRWFLVFIGIIETIRVFNYALLLIDAPSDLSLLGGFCIILALIVLWFLWWVNYGSKIYLSIKKKVQGDKNETVKHDERNGTGSSY